MWLQRSYARSLFFAKMKAKPYTSSLFSQKCQTFGDDMEEEVIAKHRLVSNGLKPINSLIISLGAITTRGYESIFQLVGFIC